MRQLLRILFPYLQFTELSVALICWIALVKPQFIVSIDPKALENFSFMMVAEFIFCHSGVFFAVLLGPMAKQMSTRAKWSMVGALTLLYSAFMLGMNLEIFVFYIFLTFSRISGSLTGKTEFKIEIIKAVLRVLFYLLTVIFAIAVFEFGISPESSGLIIEGTGGDISNRQFLNWGFWFFLLNGLVSLVLGGIFRHKKNG